MQGYDKDVVDCSPPIPRVALATMTAEREELYQNLPPTVDQIPMGDLPFLVDYGIPEDEDISWAVRRLCLNSSCGPAGMRSEHLRQWLIEVMRDNSPDATNWMKVFTIVQEAFCDGTLAKEFTWQIVVLF